METSELSLKDMHDYAWNHFSLHAKQRISVFNFFLSISALLTTGLLATFQPTFQAHIIGIGLGSLMILVSYLFWKLDQRTRYFINIAESSLAKHGTYFPIGKSDNPDIRQLVRWDEHETLIRKNKRLRNPISANLSYASIFNLVYLVFAALGLIGLIGSFVMNLELTGSFCFV